MKLRGATNTGHGAAQLDAEALSELSAAGGNAVVVGHDGHPGSDRALATAIDLAGRLGAALHVVHSVTLEDYGIDPDVDSFDTIRDRNVAAERERMSTVLADSTVTWTYHEERGEPARCLARLGRDVDAAFIVVGASHRGLFKHAMSGAVSKHLLHDQNRPVLVVPDALAKP